MVETDDLPLYPDVAPLRSFELPATGGHVLHVREWGSVRGQPVLLLHGGPGSGCSPLLWRIFDPRRYRVIAADQRGAGLSRPHGEVAHNDLGALLADLRLLRHTMGLSRWLVAGGSWGATLALAHALDMPEAVEGLLLRAIFLARREDIAGVFAPDDSASLDAWRDLLAAGQGAPGASLLARLHHRLHGDDDAARQRAVLAWWRWECVRSNQPMPEAPPAPDALARMAARYRIQSHYLRHGCWLQDPPLLERLHRLPKVPVMILHGLADRVCPPAGAMALHEAVPGSHLHWVPGAGHDPKHPAMTQALREATDGFAEHASFAAPAR